MADFLFDQGAHHARGDTELGAPDELPRFEGDGAFRPRTVELADIAVPVPFEHAARKRFTERGFQPRADFRHGRFGGRSRDFEVAHGGGNYHEPRATSGAQNGRPSRIEGPHDFASLTTTRGSDRG